MQGQGQAQGAHQIEAFGHPGHPGTGANDLARVPVDAAEDDGNAGQHLLLQGKFQGIVVRRHDQIEMLSGVLLGQIGGKPGALLQAPVPFGIHPLHMQHRPPGGNSAPLLEPLEDAVLPAVTVVVGHEHQHLGQVPGRLHPDCRHPGRLRQL